MQETKQDEILPLPLGAFVSDACESKGNTGKWGKTKLCLQVLLSVVFKPTRKEMWKKGL